MAPCPWAGARGRIGCIRLAVADRVLKDRETTSSTAPAPSASVSTTSKYRSLTNASLGILRPYVDRQDSGSISMMILGALEYSEDQDMETLLDFLGFNVSAMVNRIGNIRALDGTLSAEGCDASPSWTFHPDDGLSMVFEAKKIRQANLGKEQS